MMKKFICLLLLGPLFYCSNLKGQVPGFDLIQNGSFETGDFTGWNAVDMPAPFLPWAVSGPGAYGGFGLQNVAPQDGVFAAVNGFDGGGPGFFTLSQQIFIPPAHHAELSFNYRLQWESAFRPVNALSRELEVQILDPANNQVLAAPFHTAVGPLIQGPQGIIDTGWNNEVLDLSAFAGMDIILNFSVFIPENFTGPAQMELDAISLIVTPAGGPTVSHIDDVEVIVGTSPAPIPFLVGDPGFPGRDIEIKIESDNQFVLSNDDILHGRQGDDILLGDQPNNRLLPGGEIFPENLPPFGGGNDLLGGGPADQLLRRGIPADEIDQRVIIFPPLRRIGTANLTLTATNPNGIREELRLTVNVISDDVIIVDDGDPGFTTQGIWSQSNAEGAYNGDSLFSDHPGSKAIFTPELPGPGTYAVYIRWASRQSNAPGDYVRDRGARYVVKHGGGSTSTMVDQSRGGGRFMLLGIFDFVGDGSENVTLERVNVLGGFTSADAVRFVSAPSTDGNEQPGDLIIDNLDPSFSTSGRWHESNASDEHAGSSLFTEVVGNMAKFSAGAQLSGLREVYVRSSARSPRGGFYNRDSEALYEVKHANGKAQIIVNQNVLPGQWVFIGAFPFEAGMESYVKLTRSNVDSAQKTSADAVRFTELQPARPNEVVVDNKDPGFSSFGNWIESNALDEYLQSSWAGFGFGTTAKWTPELPTAGRYQVFAHWANQGSNGPIRRDSKAWYEVMHAGQKSTVRINQNANGGNWVSIGTFEFSGDGSEYVELFHGFEDTAPVSADAIRFLLVE